MALEAPTLESLIETFREGMIAADPSARITDESFSPAYILDLLSGGSGVLVQETIQQFVLWIRDTYTRTAVGSGLDNLVTDHLSLPRHEGVAAIGTVLFFRENDAVGNVLIPAGCIVRTLAGTRFITIADFLFTGLEGEVEIRAEEVGEVGNVASQTITKVVTPLGDSNINVTNTRRTAGGRLAETDEEYRKRARSFFETLPRGTASALVFGAKQVPGVKLASVDDTTWPPRLFFGDVTGGGNAALRDEVIAMIENYRPVGVPVTVAAGFPVSVDIQVRVTFRAGSDRFVKRQEITNAIVAAVNSLEIGATLHMASIVGAVMGLQGIANCVVLEPSGDVVPGDEVGVFRTTADRIEIV
jgi:uncharacterized phage protein gp47/JayE